MGNYFLLGPSISTSIICQIKILCYIEGVTMNRSVGIQILLFAGSVGLLDQIKLSALLSKSIYLAQGPLDRDD